MRIFSSKTLKHGLQKITFGFTLLELLIVIAVIGGLAVISINSFPAAGRGARDSTRRSDIKQFQTALETYYNRNGVYPVIAGTPTSSGACNSSNLNLPACPTDPKSTWNYTLNSIASRYVVYSSLEKPATGSVSYFVVCSDGRAGECATSPGAATTCAAGCP